MQKVFKKIIEQLEEKARIYREEMQEYFREYLKSCYKDWNESKLTYDKWAFLRQS